MVSDVRLADFYDLWLDNVRQVLWLGGLCVEINELKHRSEQITKVRHKLSYCQICKVLQTQRLGHMHNIRI